MGVASLVLGIISLVIAFFGGPFAWAGIVTSIIGVILGALGRKNPESRGISTAGLVCSIIALALSMIVFIACAACVGGLASLA